MYIRTSGATWAAEWGKLSSTLGQFEQGEGQLGKKVGQFEGCYRGLGTPPGEHQDSATRFAEPSLLTEGEAPRSGAKTNRGQAVHQGMKNLAQPLLKSSTKPRARGATRHPTSASCSSGAKAKRMQRTPSGRPSPAAVIEERGKRLHHPGDVLAAVIQNTHARDGRWSLRCRSSWPPIPWGGQTRFRQVERLIRQRCEAASNSGDLRPECEAHQHGKPMRGKLEG